MLPLVDSLLKIGASLISLLELKERRKYTDQMLELQKAYYVEYNKPYEQKNDALMDQIKFNLVLLIQAIASDLEAAKK